MKANKKIAIALVLGLAGLSTAAVAHHSFAMFDQTRTAELRNVNVVQFRWGNPHVFLVVQSGNTRYSLEGSSPSALGSSGWKFNSIKSGDTISVSYHPLRDGRPGGAMREVTLADGRVLSAG